MVYKNIVKNKGFQWLNTVFMRGLIRWECLRRDPVYIRAYREKRHYKNIPHRLLLNPEMTDRNIERIALNKKCWFRRKEVRFINMLGQVVALSPRMFISLPIVKRKHVVYKKSIPFEVTFVVNLSYMENEIKDALDRAIDSFIDELEYRSLYKRGRTQYYRNIKNYLDVYDLRQQGLTYPVIAKKVYGNVKRETALFQVKREMKKAKKYINGGYAKLW